MAGSKQTQKKSEKGGDKAQKSTQDDSARKKKAEALKKVYSGKGDTGPGTGPGTGPTKKKKEKTKPRPIHKAGSSHQGAKLRRNYTDADMKNAVEFYRKEHDKYSMNQVADHFGVPRTTFKIRLRHPEWGYGSRSGGKGESRLFTAEEENEIAALILKFNDAGFPFTPKEVRELAYELAEENGYKVSLKKEEVSYNWINKFLERHPEISVKNASEMSLYRATAQTEEDVRKWFEYFKKVLDEKGIKGGLYIWNVDETGVLSCPKARKVLGRKGLKSTIIVAGEKGETSTILAFVNALGIHTPPMIIHKGQGTRIKPEWRNYMPAEAHLRKSANGWITKELFTEYGKIFIKFLYDRKLLGERHVVILDGHRTHSYNIGFLTLMDKYGIEVLGLPPHSTHYMQPMDLTPFSAFKRAWQHLLWIYNRRRCGKKLTKSLFFTIFTRAWRHSITVGNIQSGFRRAGIWPVNFDILSKHHFKPAEMIGESTMTCSDLSWAVMFHSLLQLLL